MKRDAILVDLDGTLCDITHRRHFVQTHPKNWKAFSEAMVFDKPNPAVEFVYRALSNYKYETDIIIVSGRSDEYQEKTEKWLRYNAFNYDSLYMRKEGDYRDDSIVKGEIADEIEKTHNILFVFDDRPRVVRSWQKRGIWTFDVGQGCEDF